MKSDGGLRRLFRKHLPQVHWVSIESRFTESGIPDLEGAYKGKTFWIELKLARGSMVAMRPMQTAWILRRARAGGRVLVAVRHRTRTEDELLLVAGAAVRGLAAGGLGAVAGLRGAVLGRWQGGAGGWHWAGVLRALCGVKG